MIDIHFKQSEVMCKPYFSFNVIFRSYVLDRLAGLFRHHLASDLSRAAAATAAAGLVNGSLNERIEGGRPSGEIHGNTKIITSNGPTQQQASSTTNSGENALDYTNRCYANQQPKLEPQSEVNPNFYSFQLYYVSDYLFCWNKK